MITTQRHWSNHFQKFFKTLKSQSQSTQLHRARAADNITAVSC